MGLLPEATALVGRALRAPLRMVPRDRPLRVLSGVLAGARWISTSHTHGCWLGIYERRLQHDLASILRPGDTFFDVGANVGFFTLLASRLVTPAGRVVAFEPLRRNLRLLERHLELNGVGNVTVVSAAAAEKAGSGFLSTNQSPAQGALTATGIEVSTVSLDEVVERGEAPPPSAMKIDVEGAETRVLEGAREVLGRWHPTVFLSAHGVARHEECRSLLEERGYRVRLTRDGAADGQYESIACFPRAELSS